MPVRRLSEMTWTEVRELDLARAVAILPLGAVEAHGPHLPLGTDVVIAEAMAEAGARRLAAAGRHCLLLPALAYTAAPFAAAFPGTVSIRPEALRDQVVDAGRAVAAWGVPILALANAHFDPAHLGALAAAVEELGRRGRPTVVFPDVTRRPWAPRLGEEFLSGACHAGRYEGSVVLAARPELVREGVRRGLAPNPRSLVAAIREGKESFVAAGGPEAYFGDPAAASWQEGERTIEVLGAILAEAVLAAAS